MWRHSYQPLFHHNDVQHIVSERVLCVGIGAVCNQCIVYLLVADASRLVMMKRVYSWQMKTTSH